MLEQFQGLLEVAHGVGGGQGVERHLAGPACIGDGLAHVDQLGGLQPVVSELPHAGVGVRSAEFFQDLGNLAVCPRPTRPPQVLVEGVLDQSMGEGVTVGSVRCLAHERHLRGFLQQVDDPALVESRSRGEKPEVELASDDGGQAEHPSGFGAQAGHAGRDHLLDARRQEHLRRAGPPRSRLVPVDRTAVLEVAQHLAHEEGVPVGLLVDGVSQRQAALREIVTGRRLQEADHLVVLETPQGDAIDPGLPAQRAQRLDHEGRELRVAIGADDEQTQRITHLDHVTQQLEARRVGPLHVVEHEHDGSIPRRLLEDADDGSVEPVPLRVRVDLVGGREVAEPRRQPPAQARQGRTVGLDVTLERSELGVSDVVLERLDKRTVGNSELLVAAPEEHDGPLVVGAPRHLGSQRGLALSRLPGDQEHLAALVARRPLQRCGSVLCVDLAPDDARGGHVLQPTGQRDALGGGGHLGGGERLPHELERLHRADHALELKLPHGTHGVRVATPRHRLDQAPQEDLAGLGAGAQPGRFDHRIAKAVLPLPRDLPRAQADPHRQLVPSAAAFELDLLLHGDRARQGARSRRKRRHDAVSEALDLDPAALGEHPPQDGEVSPPQLVGGLWRAGVRQFRRADEVGEQDGHTLGRRHLAALWSNALAPKEYARAPQGSHCARAR